VLKKGLGYGGRDRHTGAARENKGRKTGQKPSATKRGKKVS